MTSPTALPGFPLQKGDTIRVSVASRWPALVRLAAWVCGAQLPERNRLFSEYVVTWTTP